MSGRILQLARGREEEIMLSGEAGGQKEETPKEKNIQKMHRGGGGGGAEVRSWSCVERR